MALDVYVGSLTRYYAGDWESIADKKGQRPRTRDRGDVAASDPGKESEGIRQGRARLARAA